MHDTNNKNLYSVESDRFHIYIHADAHKQCLPDDDRSVGDSQNEKKYIFSDVK